MTEGSPVALVTGAGTGIGRATALRLAEGGHAVMLAGRRPTPLEEVAHEVQRAGGSASTISGDVSTPDGAQRAVACAVEAHGRLDVLVCNHGVGSSALFDQETPEQWDQTLQINLTG